MNAAYRRSPHLLVAVALMAASPLAAAAPRLLLVAPQVEVRMDDELRCHRGAEVSIVAQDPLLFTGDSPRMQSLIDATRAVLGYECRNLAGISVNGYLAGLDGTRYKAVAGPEDDWWLQASQTMAVSSSSSPAPVAPGWPSQAESPAPAVGAGDFVVRDLHRGMRLDEAVEALRGSFAGEPRYEQPRRVLSVVEGGCPIAGETLRRHVPPRAGDACLEAKFSADGRELLEHLNYGQVVDMDQSVVIRAALQQRYGQPVKTWRLDPTSTRMAWGRLLPGQLERYELEALINVGEATTVLVVQLSGGQNQAVYQVNF